MKILFALFVLCVVTLAKGNEENSPQVSVVHKDYGPKAGPALVTAKRIERGYYHPEPPSMVRRVKRPIRHKRPEIRRPGHRRPGHRKPENRRFERQRPHKRPIRRRHHKRTAY
nr:uncharacterized protein LOC110384636 [Helicoverpa armigera]